MIQLPHPATPEAFNRLLQVIHKASANPTNDSCLGEFPTDTQRSTVYEAITYLSTYIPMPMLRTYVHTYRAVEDFACLACLGIPISLGVAT